MNVLNGDDKFQCRTKSSTYWIQTLNAQNHTIHDTDVRKRAKGNIMFSNNNGEYYNHHQIVSNQFAICMSWFWLLFEQNCTTSTVLMWFSPRKKRQIVYTIQIAPPFPNGGWFNQWSLYEKNRKKKKKKKIKSTHSLKQRGLKYMHTVLCLNIHAL